MSYPYFDRAFGTIVKTSRAPHEKFKQEELNALLVMGIRYGEKHRRWHTLAHMEKTVEIAQMLGGNEATLWDAMMHDIVYSPGETNNEENSLIMAAFFYEAMQLDIGWSKERSGILATKTHQSDDPQVQMLIDADLHILQAPIDEYMAYAKAIRYEYGYISDDDYREGRTKFLEGFLSRPNIYYHLRHLDEYARSNMRHEIDILADLQKSDAILKAD